MLLTNAVRTLLCGTLMTLPVAAQPTPPFIDSVENAASYAGTIAPGSIFVVYGYGLGPAQLVQANSSPLPTVLSGTTITVTSGTTAAVCPMVYTSSGAAAAVLPSNVPPGSA